MAHTYADVPMLARTHGQPATPTTFGKEMAVSPRGWGRPSVVWSVLLRASRKARRCVGNLRAHVDVPDVDATFAQSIVNGLGLEHDR